MIVAVAILFALVCIAASAWRLWLVTHATALEPDDVLAWWEGEDATLEGFARIVDRIPEADWERDLVVALREPRPEARVAFVNEQLTELDYRMQRWGRVPRVGASVASSVGILLGTLVLRRGLAEAPDLTGELGQLFVQQIVGSAVSVASFGMVATAFCIGAHSHAGRLSRARLAAADRMVEQLESAGRVKNLPLYRNPP